MAFGVFSKGLPALATIGGLTFAVHIGQQRQHPRPLDGSGQVALLLCRQARDAARQNFATLGDELAEQIDILVIDLFIGLNGGNATTEVGHSDLVFSCGNKLDKLLNFFVHGMCVAVGAELFQLHAPSGVAAVLLSGVPRNPRRALVGV